MDKRKQALQRIRELGILAVIRGPSLELTKKMVSALVEGGITGIEITFTTPDALQVVEELDREFSDQILLGMGTLTNPEQAERAAQAGARFLVSPHTDQELAQAMAGTGLPFMLGALTPTEIQTAWKLGCDVVKLFPGSLGGPALLKSIRGPFPEIPIMPTGGVDENNILDWFTAGAFAVGAGSNLCPKPLALSGQFTKITEIARTYQGIVQQAIVTTSE